MALKALMLRKKIDDKKAELAPLEKRSEELESREAELEGMIAEAETAEEKEAVEKAVDDHLAEKKDTESKADLLRQAIKALEDELQEEERCDAARSEKKEIRKVEEKMEKKEMNLDEIRKSKEYVRAFAKYLRTEDDTEVRALLSTNVEGGVVPVPEIVESRIRTIWENDEIMKRVRRTFMRGNIRIGFEISATDAAIHAEGTAAPAEETLTFGAVSLVPQSIKKWITISDEVLDLTDEEFLRYIYDELTYKIVEKAASTLLAKITGAGTANTATAIGIPKLSAAPALGTVASAIAMLSKNARNPVIIMNRSTWAAFKAIQYGANYAIDPFEGLEVIFDDDLPAYSAATANAVYMVVGDLERGAQANFPANSGVRIKFDELSLAEKDMVKLVGRMYVALGITAPGTFVNITKPAA